MLVVVSIFFGLMDNDWSSSGTPWYYFGATRELFTVLAAGGGAALVAVLWALLIYKPRRRRSHRHHSGFNRPTERAAAPSTNGKNGASHNHVRQWRRRRRGHRPRNPTLAERGGLPPMRPERPSEPFQ